MKVCISSYKFDFFFTADSSVLRISDPKCLTCMIALFLLNLEGAEVHLLLDLYAQVFT